MKLDDGDPIVGVALCTAERRHPADHRARPRIRFTADDVRVFAGRDSTGVRGIRLAEGDSVISMAILRPRRRHAGRARRLPQARQRHARGRGRRRRRRRRRRVEADDEAEARRRPPCRVERIAELGAAEEFILTVSTEGFGKRTSAYEYPPHRPRRPGPDWPRT